MNEQNGSRNYKGWANYETWAVNLWLENDRFSRWYWPPKAFASARSDGSLPASQLAEQLRESMTEEVPAGLEDVALSEVDWAEIVERMMAELDRWMRMHLAERMIEGEIADRVLAELGLGMRTHLDERMLGAARDRWPTGSDSCDGSPMPSMDPQSQPQEQPEGVKSIREENPFGELIFAYTRAQAIEDGVLVDVTETAKEAGFRFPVALTRAVYERYVTVPEGVEAQDERGRLWDIVYMTGLAIRGAGGRSEIPVSLHVRNSNRRGTPPLVTLKALCGPGDRGEPVITILLPDEDWPLKGPP